MLGHPVESYEAFFADDAPVWWLVEVDGVSCWHFRPPCGHGNLLGPKPPGAGHEVDAHEDGMISVLPKPNNSNSILCYCGWHGYINHGDVYEV